MTESECESGALVRGVGLGRRGGGGATMLLAVLLGQEELELDAGTAGTLMVATFNG